MFRVTFLFLVALSLVSGDHHQTHQVEFASETVDETKNLEESQIEVKCGLDGIRVKIPTPHPFFSGMIYPLGLSKNSSCLAEYEAVTSSKLEYKLPLRACNTMKNNDDSKVDFTEEFYNTIILEPHPKLVTGKGKGFHIRCKYANSGVKISPSSPKTERVAMRIKSTKKAVEESQNDSEVKHGKKLIQIGDQIEIEIEPEDSSVPFIVTDCKVRDGLGWSEETLLNKDGCPTDPEIFGAFRYENLAGNDEAGSKGRRRAVVKFLAHKFPYSPSVYYSCAVRFCPDGEESSNCLPPECDATGINKNFQRGKRETFVGEDSPATIEVYNGILVEENPNGIDNADIGESEGRSDALCFKKRDFALAIAFSGLFLMIAVIVLLFALCLRRRGGSRKGSSIDGSGSSIYSTTVGGYTNTAYSHSS